MATKAKLQAHLISERGGEMAGGSWFLIFGEVQMSLKDGVELVGNEADVDW